MKYLLTIVASLMITAAHAQTPSAKTLVSKMTLEEKVNAHLAKMGLVW